MKKSMILLILALSLALGGCSWGGNYVSVTPHRQQNSADQTGISLASDYPELLGALEEIISSGAESGVIHVPDYPKAALEIGMNAAARYARNTYPVGAYAVEDIQYELGTGSGMPAYAVTVTYRHSRSEIQRIRQLANMEEAREAVSEALRNHDAGIVMLVDRYHAVDFSQLVKDYAEQYPEYVMEIPQVSAGIYGTGENRVVELAFTYQTSRDSLRQMQLQVDPVFDSAALYVSGNGEERQKFSQLYAFLMERFDYEYETSITPAYSLLRHGVGDSRAFATVYAAMCRGAELECLVVSGTRYGEPWTWNMVLDNGHYYHVDLIRCSDSGHFREMTDQDMSGYVWDYSAYPECPTAYVPPEQETEAADPTENLE